MRDLTEANPNELNQDDARYGFRCCHLKNIWTAPLPPETVLSRQMTTSTTSIDIMGLQAAYANLHTDQEGDYFMQRYHDVISSFGGKTSYDADNRPFLVVFNRPINILCRVSLFLSMALCLLLRLFVFRLLRLKRFSTLTLKVL